MTEAIWQFFLDISNSWHLVFLGLISFIENIFPPFPGDVLYIALSGLGSSRNIPTFILWLPGVVGSIVSTFILYSMGRSSELERLETLVIRSSGKNGVKKAKELLEKHGPWILVFSRFIPGIRSLLVIAASSTGMKKSSVIFYTSVSIVFWYALLVFAGTILGAELSKATDFMSELTVILIIAILAAILVGIFVLFFRMRRSKK